MARLDWQKETTRSGEPHPDSTWPHSQQVIAAQMADLPEPTRRRVTCENARVLYGLDDS